MKKYISEFIGTFVLVFLGTGTVAIANNPSSIGFLAIGLSFGLAVTIMASVVGKISGGHFNPAVTIAMLINKRNNFKDVIGYIVSQFLGAIAESSVISIFVKALNISKSEYGATNFLHVNAVQAFAFEVIITFLFIFIILMVTSSKYGNSSLAPIIIGLALSFLIIVALNVTGGSLNPARSLGPALFARGSALTNYWVYLCAPIVGSIMAALVAKQLGSEEK